PPPPAPGPAGSSHGRADGAGRLEMVNLRLPTDRPGDEMATVQEFFAKLPTAVDPAKTAGMNNSYVFDVEGVGAWTVRVADGAVSVAEGAEDADCTISAS